MADVARSSTGPRPSHPLAGARPHGIPVVIIILIGWLSARGWTCEQITALLLVILPSVANTATKND